MIKRKNIIKKIIVPLTMSLGLVVSVPVDSFADPAKNSTDDRIHFLDTGKGGDAIIIESNGRFAMVDSGESTPQNVETIKKYLKDIGADHLDYFIATHIHSDHIGNIASLINSGIKVENIIATDIPEINPDTVLPMLRLMTLKPVRMQHLTLLSILVKSGEMRLFQSTELIILFFLRMLQHQFQ